MSKILALANQKGGVGKTTLVCHYALAVAQAKVKKGGQRKRVLVVDLDPQGNCTRFLTSTLLTQEPERGEGYTRTINLFNPMRSDFVSNFKPYPARDGVDLVWTAKNDSDLAACAEAPTPAGQHPLAVALNVAENIRAVADQYDLVIIDSAPTLSKLQLCALLGATDVACPIKMSGFGLDGAEGLMNMIKEIKSGPNKELNFLGVILNQETTSSSIYKTEVAQLRELVGDLLFDNGISYRRTFDQAASESKPIWKIHTGSSQPAKKEMLAVLKELHKKIFN